MLLSMLYNFESPEYLLEELTAILTLSLYAFFMYISGRHKYSFSYYDHYPHPIIRSFYIRDVIIAQLQQRKNINTQKVTSLSQKYFSQFHKTLQTNGLNQDDKILANIAKELDKYNAFISKTAQRFRQFSKKWSWIPIEDWE